MQRDHRGTPNAGSANLDPRSLEEFEHHLGDEADPAFLYRALAGAEPDERRRGIDRRLPEVEDRHVAIWADLLTHPGGVARSHQPSARARLLAGAARRFGSGFLLPILLAE